MLGRQRVNRPGEVDRIKAALALRGITVARAQIIDQRRYADRLFKMLELGDFHVIDVSTYEGADVVLDLNRPIPPEVSARFGFIYDGGTTEHIFDVPCAFRNIDQMLKPGGSFVSCVPMNGWPGHGFYQMQPSLVYSFWRDVLGYEVDFCVALPAGQPIEAQAHALKDGHRGNWKLPPAMADQEVNLCYGVTKPLAGAEGRVSTEVQQGFYKDTWRVRGAKAVLAGAGKEGEGAVT